jgi:hypothetical protein
MKLDRSPAITVEYGRDQDKAKITTSWMRRTTKPAVSNFVYYK